MLLQQGEHAIVVPARIPELDRVTAITGQQPEEALQPLEIQPQLRRELKERERALRAGKEE